MGDGDFPAGQPPHEASADKAGRPGQEGPSTPDRGPGRAGSGRTDGPSPEAVADNGESEAPSPRGDEAKGQRICASKHRSLQITRTGKRKLFDKKARKGFLGWFAATGNVVWSARKVGFSDKTVWKHRMNDPRFAEDFDRALEQSVVRNKARMVERKAKEKPIAIDGGIGEAELEDCDLEKAWPLIVEMERAKGRNGGGGGAPIGRPRDRGRMPRAASNAQVRKELEKRLRAFGRRCRAEGREPPDWLPPVEPRKSGKDRDGRP